MKVRALVLGLALASLGVSIPTSTVAQEPAAATPAATQAAPPEAVAATQPVDLAICLDTSGSMSGLIESAKQKLWAVVNELASATPTPDLRVGLIHYGNTGLDAATGWVEQKLDLTADLDEVYNQLFALTTNGGQEYVARAITKARESMTWSAAPRALKIVFVCGNEPATQDPQIPVTEACQAAVTQDIIVNSIYCGSPQSDEALGWQDVAKLADGEYGAIDQDSGTVVVATPFDAEITELGAKLNTTYVARAGAEGERGAANQMRQDSNAAGLGGGIAADRAMAKAGAMYRNAGWDLVDASQEEGFDLASVPEDELPENMRPMSLEERSAYLASQLAARQQIQQQVADLGRKRTEFIQSELQKQNLDGSKALDFAVRQAVRRQAESKGFVFAEPTPPPAPQEEPAAPEAATPPATPAK